ncbi:nuclear transport factor 2 family protein [Flavobacterium sp. MC2016-06]|uniref:nuclear transport factor 2 family protein n=1 Tax=Flavobacterium sp. MC2016-06 TaxID=2676308 RepID=UPI0012BA63F4|nr:nuclear transport factor 2 family protein [Flavobacterium sp. MC2016-06]MBU3861559.1 nuclear transport factor 2 family protein [Flavobacterium sp. MC2016-06]
MNRNELEDKIALKELIDTISILGDKKDFENQVQLFSENAISETIAEGKTILKLEGRKEMAETFEKFLQDFETIYHFNGQQVITINGDNAAGTSYCLITLISSENNKKTKTTIGATYEDKYICVNNKWLVAKRIGNFKWQNKIEIPL